MLIGENIKNLREDKNISINLMVKKLRVFKNQYELIEKNIKPVNTNLLSRIANILGVSSNEIINYNKDLSRNEKKQIDIKNLRFKEINTKSLNVEPIKIGEITYIPIVKPTVREIIFKKPQLLNRDDIFKFSNNINLVGVNNILPETQSSDIVNPLDGLIVDSKKTGSPMLINWVEPYRYKGEFKTLFYTEVNSGLRVGDRVFIINGIYDSNKLVENDKYSKKTDGYKILFIDNCRVVLDIDYTGESPYIEADIDKFIGIYIVEDELDFKYYNRKITTENDEFNFKFENNSIIFTEKDYGPISGWGKNNGISGSPGFFKRDGDQWINVTNSLLNGDLSNIQTNSSYNKLKVINGNFRFSNINFDKNKVYSWSEKLEKWVVNSNYIKPILSKSNFRGGDFKGEWNSGLYGQEKERIKWKGYPGKWNLGTIFNTEWESGDIKSLYSLEESFVSEFEDGSPYQKLNGPNNNGWGYNYIIDSLINNSNIENGNFINSKVGKSVDFSVVENYILGTQSNYSFNIDKASLIKSELIGGFAKEVDMVESTSYNTKFENIKCVNSSFKESLIKDSKYLSDGDIKILAYGEMSVSLNDLIPNESTHKVYKFYISKEDYKKLKHKNNFYIKGLKIDDNSKYPLNFFDKKFKLSTWTEYIDFYDMSLDRFYKRGTEMACFVSSPEDNKWMYNWKINSTSNNTITTRTDQSIDDLYSVDIFISIFDINSSRISSTNNWTPNSELNRYGLNIDKDTEPATNSEPNKNNNQIRRAIDITEAFICNSDFESGLIETTDWISGNHINYNNDVNISKLYNNLGEYDIVASTASSTITVKTSSNFTSDNFDTGVNCFNVGNIVFLNNVYYLTESNEYIKLGDTYKILNNDFSFTGQLILEEIGTNIISFLPDVTGKFLTPDANNRYNYIHKSKIKSCKIKSGIFRRAFISNSFIENENYDTSDRLFNNLDSIKQLVISDSIFKDTDNILSKATYLNTSFSGESDQFKDGIVFNSIWNGLDFGNGLFKESTWLGGKFRDGVFYNNNSFNAIPTVLFPTYDTNRIKSYYISGTTSKTVFNNRHSWQDGEFINGIFLRSDWEDGDFNGGEFLISKFYKGSINGGIFGNQSLKSDDTRIYSAEINSITVDNATVLSDDPNLNPTQSTINWYNGTFNNGVFGSRNSLINRFSVSSVFDPGNIGGSIGGGITPLQIDHIATWHNGIFNGGEFISLGKWKNGTFNGGIFSSGFGHSMSQTSQDKSEYGWEDGIFNGGIFGNESIIINSTWFNGTFNGGKFVGKIWNNGLFRYGTFEGSAKNISAIIDSENSEPSFNASVFNDSFQNNFYGLWKSGIVDNTSIDNVSELNGTAIMRNFLWRNGMFNHQSGTIENSVWLDGRFLNGNFKNSSFNPYVKRGSSTNPNFRKSDSTCFWGNGKAHNSDFYYSKWKNGTFNLGNCFGVIWENGICEYMNAFNILWKKGLWKNGNWNGSYVDFDGEVKSGFEWELLGRISSFSGNNELHIWNIFEDSSDGDTLIDSQEAGEIISF